MRRLTVLSVVAVFVLAIAGPAMAGLDVEGQVTSRVQSLSGDAGAAENQEAGFNDALLNIQLYGDVATDVSAFAEAEAAGGDFDLAEAYITLSDLVPSANAKMGRFDVNFGNQHMRRSDNADVQSNNLIGNPLVDPVSEQEGLELSGEYKRVAWSLAATNGTAGSSFGEDRGFGMNAKVWGEIMPGLKAAFSWYSVDQSDWSDSTAGSNMFADNGSSASAYDLMSGATVDPLTGNFAGQDVSAMQLDLAYDLAVHDRNAEIYAFYGDVSDDSSGVKSEFDYWGVGFRQGLTPNSYLAARYNKLTMDESMGSTWNNNNEANRLQVGLGHKLAPNTLAKLEYVTQETDSNLGSTNDEFSGVVGELSVSF